LPKSPNKTLAIPLESLYALKPGALWKAFREQPLPFKLLCFYYFIEYVRAQTLYPVLDILPWAQITLLATLVTAILDPTVKWVSHPVNRLLVSFYLVMLISSLLAFMPSQAWEERNVVLGWLLVYFLTISLVDTEKKLILFVIAYFLFNLKMAQHGTITWASRGFSFAGWGLVGSPGWFRNSGEFAIQMLIYGSLSLSFVLALRAYWGRFKRWLLVLAALTGYMAVMGASSRGAQLGLAAIAIWALLKLKWGMRGIIVIGILVAVLFVILPDEQIARLREMGEDADSLQRLTYWKYALDEVIPKFPVLGLGYHNWLAYLSFMVPEGMVPHAINQEPHNIYIQAAAELGLAGLFIFLLLVAAAFIYNYKTRKMAAELENRLLFFLSYGLDAGLMGYLVAGSFVSVFYYPFFWVQLTMVVMVNHIARKLHAKRKEPDASP